MRECRKIDLMAKMHGGPKMSETIKVLIVDDDPFMGEVYESLISDSHNIEVEYLQSGYEAIEFLSSEKVHLVVTDYYMVNGNGGTLCHYCHDHGISCVVISSHGAEDLSPYLPKDTVILYKPSIARSRQLEDLVKQTLLAHNG